MMKLSTCKNSPSTVAGKNKCHKIYINCEGNTYTWDNICPTSYYMASSTVYMENKRTGSIQLYCVQGYYTGNYPTTVHQTVTPNYIAGAYYTHSQCAAHILYLNWPFPPLSRFTRFLTNSPVLRSQSLTLPSSLLVTTKLSVNCKLVTALWCLLEPLRVWRQWPVVMSHTYRRGINTLICKHKHSV